MNFPPEYVLPYSISNLIALALLAFSFQRPNIARWGISLIFGYACIYNSWIGLTRPEAYQGFADLAILGLYKDFIHGYFREHATALLVSIAFGQGVVAVTLALGGKFLKIGVLGTCIFLTAIVPLWVGSAFPFSLIVSAAAIVLQRKLDSRQA